MIIIMPPRPVILDTNFLLLPFQYKIDIFTEIDYLLEMEHEFVISSAEIRELERLSEDKGKKGIAARLALKMVDANRIEIVESKKPVDDWIVEYAEKTGAIVCTNDRKLRKRLKEVDIKIIALLGKSRVGFA
jgi:hypothetical protein